MCICAKRFEQRGSALALSMLFLLVFSLLLISSMKLALTQNQLTQIFYHKTRLVNQAESVLAALRDGRKPNIAAHYVMRLDHRDVCLNQYYLVEVQLEDALARVLLKAMLVKAANQVLSGCEVMRSRVVYEEVV